VEEEKGELEKQIIASQFIQDTTSTMKKFPTQGMDDKTKLDISKALETLIEPQEEYSEKGCFPKFAEAVKALASTYRDLMDRLTGDDLKKRKEESEGE